jgi:hypothetical protein
VIHTVGPIWGQGDEEKLLCMVRNAMSCAIEYAWKELPFLPLGLEDMDILKITGDSDVILSEKPPERY